MRCHCAYLEPDCDVLECCLFEPGCECCTDDDCWPDMVCKIVSDGEQQVQVCLPPCQEEGQACGPDLDDCCQGLACHPEEATCVPACEQDEDCRDGSDRYAGDRVCEDQVCQHVSCEQGSDCPEQQRCFEGLCLSPVPCDWLAYCAIDPLQLTLGPGEQAQFGADAYMRNNEAVPVAGFVWSSDDPDLVTVDADGLVAAGPDPGETSVTAQVDGCLFVCSARVFVAEP